MGWWSSACCFSNYTIKISQPNRRYVGIRKASNGSVNLQFSSSSTSSCFLVRGIEFRDISYKPITYKTTKIANCTTSGTETDLQDSSSSADVDCVGTGLDVECLVSSPTSSASSSSSPDQTETQIETQNQTQQTLLPVSLEEVWEWAVLVSPFFFWGTAMVAMKEVLPKAGPFFVSAFRLIPSGFLLIAFAASRGRRFPSGILAWFSIAVFGLVDATCFQGFLAQGLERTSAGLGSVSTTLGIVGFLAFQQFM